VVWAAAALALISFSPAPALAQQAGISMSAHTTTTPDAGAIHTYDATTNRLESMFVVGLASNVAGASTDWSSALSTGDLSAVPAVFVAAETAAKTPGVIRAGELKLPGVPKGAVGTVTRNGEGLIYPIPRGTAELSVPYVKMTP